MERGWKVPNIPWQLVRKRSRDISFFFFPLFLNTVSTPLGPAGPTSPKCSATHPILVLESRSHPSLFHQCFEKQVTAQTGSGMPCTAGQQSFGGRKEGAKEGIQVSSQPSQALSRACLTLPMWPQSQSPPTPSGWLERWQRWKSPHASPSPLRPLTQTTVSTHLS